MTLLASAHSLSPRLPPVTASGNSPSTIMGVPVSLPSSISLMASSTLPSSVLPPGPCDRFHSSYFDVCSRKVERVSGSSASKSKPTSYASVLFSRLRPRPTERTGRTMAGAELYDRRTREPSSAVVRLV